MNLIPESLIAISTREYSPEFQQLIIGKREDFVGREFVFAAMTVFLHRCDRTYFTIISAPSNNHHLKSKAEAKAD